MIEDGSRNLLPPCRRSVQVSRRRLLLGAAAIAAAPVASGAPTPLLARASPHRIRAGAIDITVLSDGTMTMAQAVILPGRERRQIEASFTAAGETFKGFAAEVNVALVQTGAETVLVDAGGGLEWIPGLGRLPERLAAAGVRPDAITKVVLTHAHADHFWGVMDSLTGDTLFEKAPLVLSAAEQAFWLRPDVTSRVAEGFQGMAAGTHRRLNALAGRVKAARPGEEVAPGLVLVDTGGHTPGHVSVLVGSGSEQVMIVGDALTQHVISFAEPDWRWGSDMDPDRAIASRRRLLDRLATDRVRLLGYHLPWPGIGRVERKGTSFRFVPE
jgi:glyoxylase-like metal-dependent hydrolase (beta-lactamase superfamily II)